MSPSAGMITATIDGQSVTVPKGTTIYDAAAKLGISIPVLCHREHMNPVAVCRVCSVEVVGARVWAPACYRELDDKMVVKTHRTSERLKKNVGTLLELLTTENLTAERPDHKYEPNELEKLADEFKISSRRLPNQTTKTRMPHPTKNRGQDDSSPIISVDHNACILCDRCIRACNDVRHNFVLGRMGKGHDTKIAFDLGNPMGESSCVACGECMISCPTGALSHKGFVEPNFLIKDPKRDKPVKAEELVGLPLFEGVSAQFLKWNEGSVVRRFYKAGEIICREGETGNTAFYIEQGSVDIYIQAKLGRAKSKKDKRSGKSRLWGLLPLLSFQTEMVTGEEKELDEVEVAQQYIQIDAPVSLKLGSPQATLSQGDLFGEQSVLNNLPRSATVRARENVVVLEMMRNVFYILRRNKKSCEMIDARFKDRVIQNFFRSIPMFSEVASDEHEHARFAVFMQGHAEVVRLDPGHVLFRQGEAATDFYIVQSGFIKVSQQTAAGERVLSYLGKGDCFGEIAFLSEIPEIQELAPQGVRTATCSSLDHSTVIKINGKDFVRVLENFPGFRKSMTRIAEKRLKDNAEMIRRLESSPLGEFLDRGLQEAQNLLVLDLEKCTRCDECTKACSDSHDGITRLIREGLRFDRFLVASSCRSCLDPYCIPHCPVGAINRGTKSMEIVIKDHCIGCAKCAEACPYGNINMHEFPSKIDDPDHPGRKKASVAMKATTCDLCTSYDGVPSCVYACPHDAAHRMKGTELLESVTMERLS